MAYLSKPLCAMKVRYDFGEKAVNRAIIIVTILSVLLILAGVPLILGMSGTEDIGVMSVLMGIMGFIMRACLKGFLSIVIAAEKYIERNRTIE